MAGDELFGELPNRPRPPTTDGGRGAPRMREPVRDQIELRAVDIDSLIGEAHPVRVIWAYVEGLDLSELEDRIKARENTPGHPPISPQLLLGLWLYATSEGVGSARALALLCESHDVYRWLCGGVSVNYHTLSDFRVGCADLNPYLAFAALIAAGIAGIENKLTLEPAFSGDAYTGKKLRDIPKTLRAATDSLRKSNMLRAAMGDNVVDHYVHAAEWEQLEYDRRITDWELKRGFERS